jgi:hypothetical protein
MKEITVSIRFNLRYQCCLYKQAWSRGGANLSNTKTVWFSLLIILFQALTLKYFYSRAPLTSYSNGLDTIIVKRGRCRGWGEGIYSTCSTFIVLYLFLGQMTVLTEEKCVQCLET